MKDFRGKELKVGDNVVFIEMWGRSGANLKLGKVIRFTAKYIFIDIGEERQVRKTPSHVTLIKEEKIPWESMGK